MFSVYLGIYMFLKCFLVHSTHISVFRPDDICCVELGCIVYIMHNLWLVPNISPGYLMQRWVLCKISSLYAMINVWLHWKYINFYDECSDSHIYILCTLFLYQYYLCLKFVCAFYVLFCGLTLLSRLKLLYGINFNLGAGCCI